MSGVLQTVFQNHRSFAIAIGDAYQGGFYAGQISTGATGIADYNLVVGPLSSAQSTLQWKTTNTSTTGTSSNIDGPTNSSNMNNASHPAAEFCEGLTIGGFSDWYMPARNELEICYYNLKPTTDNNNTSTGANSNAVPTRGSNYSAGTPAQTSAATFQTGNAEAFSSAYYWGSTEKASADAWNRLFVNGFENYFNKNDSRPVRAVRRVAV